MSEHQPTRSNKVRRLSRGAFISEKHGLRSPTTALRRHSAKTGRFVARSVSTKRAPFK